MESRIKKVFEYVLGGLILALILSPFVYWSHCSDTMAKNYMEANK